MVTIASKMPELLSSAERSRPEGAGDTAKEMREHLDERYQRLAFTRRSSAMAKTSDTKQDDRQRV